MFFKSLHTILRCRVGCKIGLFLSKNLWKRPRHAIHLNSNSPIILYAYAYKGFSACYLTLKASLVWTSNSPATAAQHHHLGSDVNSPSKFRAVTQVTLYSSVFQQPDHVWWQVATFLLPGRALTVYFLCAYTDCSSLSISDLTVTDVTASAVLHCVVTNSVPI